MSREALVRFVCALFAVVAIGWAQAGGPVARPASAEPPASRPAMDVPRPPFPYYVEEVTFENKAAGITFHGTVTRPEGRGPWPAAVLIAGAGAHDRDETVGLHKPFMVIADRLTRQGMAILRYDKRGVRGTRGDVMKATSVDLAKDAEAGFDYLRGRPDVDASRVGVIGHSEGGMLVFIITGSRPEVAFAVSLAGVSTDCETASKQFALLLARGAGVSELILIPGRLLIGRIIDVLKASKDQASAEAELRTFVPAEFIPFVASPWVRFFVTYDPRPSIERTHCPVLGIYCENDVMVSPTTNARALRLALVRGGNTTFDVETFPETNHMLQPASKRQAMDFTSSAFSIAPPIMEKLTTWLAAHVGRPAGDYK